MSTIRSIFAALYLRAAILLTPHEFVREAAKDALEADRPIEWIEVEWSTDEDDEHEETPED